MKIEYPDESTEISVSCVNPTPGHSDDHTQAETEMPAGECAPLISVIVPIYNVEKYVRKCLESLKNQTMKRIEVICIDDGSTDRSGLIADEYKTSPGVWPVFRVIHTENRGLSAARNRGIDESLSDWIMFVDSDDWVDERFCEIPYRAAIENNADLVIFQADCWRNGRTVGKKSVVIPKDIIDELAAHEYGGKAAWNKFYKKCLFCSIQYPEGRVYEDLATTHKLVHEAKKILMIQKLLYHRVLRNGSITHTYSIQNIRDGFVSAKERYSFLSVLGYEEMKLKEDLCGSAIDYLSVMQPCDEELYLEAKTIVETTERIPQGISKKQKAWLFVWNINPCLFHLLCMSVGRRKIGSERNRKL